MLQYVLGRFENLGPKEKSLLIWYKPEESLWSEWPFQRVIWQTLDGQHSSVSQPTFYLLAIKWRNEILTQEIRFSIVICCISPSVQFLKIWKLSFFSQGIFHYLEKMFPLGRHSKTIVQVLNQISQVCMRLYDSLIPLACCIKWHSCVL